MVVEPDSGKTPMNGTTQEDINTHLEDVYEVNDDRLQDPKSKPITRGDTDRPLYKEGWAWNGIDHSRVYVCQ